MSLRSWEAVPDGLSSILKVVGSHGGQDEIRLLERFFEVLNFGKWAPGRSV